MKRIAGLAVAVLLLPFSYALHLALRGWEFWHFGPSQRILRFLKWLNYKAFTRIAEWVDDAVNGRRNKQRANIPDEFRKVGIKPTGKPGSDKAGTLFLVIIVTGILMALMALHNCAEVF